jgi:hypothetical protein
MSAGDGIAHPLFRIEGHSHLVVVTDACGRPGNDGSGRGLTAAGYEIEQRRFAGAVGADEAETFARIQEEFDPFEQRRMSLVGERDIVKFDDLVAEARCPEPQIGDALTGRRFKVKKPDLWNTRLSDPRRAAFE